MSSSTPTPPTDKRPDPAVPMRELLAACAAAAAVSTPPRPAGRQAITVTLVPTGAKSQSV